jgi:hypothetical protein
MEWAHRIAPCASSKYGQECPRVDAFVFVTQALAVMSGKEGRWFVLLGSEISDIEWIDIRQSKSTEAVHGNIKSYRADQNIKPQEGMYIRTVSGSDAMFAPKYRGRSPPAPTHQAFVIKFFDTSFILGFLAANFDGHTHLELLRVTIGPLQRTSWAVPDLGTAAN